MTDCHQPSIWLYLSPALTFAVGILLGILIRGVAERNQI